MLDSLVPEWTALAPLDDKSVRVFALRADGDPELLRRAGKMLTGAECERAARFRLERAREEFIVGRALLRMLLGRVLDVAPDHVPLQMNESGKPFVPGLHANVSHSRGLVYLALCRAAAVGVDVEWVDPAIEATELALANFSPEEASLVHAPFAMQERAEVFCRLWTRKEAVAKAYGCGLHVPPSAIAVPFTGAGQAKLREVTMPAGQEPVFHVSELWAPPGYVAALAVLGNDRPARLFRRI